MEALLRPKEAAEMLNVDARTLKRWCSLGWLRVAMTPGGHRRYLRSEIEKIAEARYNLTPEPEEQP